MNGSRPPTTSARSRLLLRMRPCGADLRKLDELEFARICGQYIELRLRAWASQPR